jgi:hypothetical protein
MSAVVLWAVTHLDLQMHTSPEAAGSTVPKMLVLTYVLTMHHNRDNHNGHLHQQEKLKSDGEA